MASKWDKLGGFFGGESVRKMQKKKEPYKRKEGEEKKFHEAMDNPNDEARADAEAYNKARREVIKKKAKKRY